MIWDRLLILNEGTIANWNTVLANSDMLKNAVDVLKIIDGHGYQAYLVGGVVRDLIMKKEPHDVDIATNMPGDKISRIFDTYDLGKGKSFGVVGIKHHGFTYEIANFRSDEYSGSSDARHPDKVELVTSFEKDSARRDFSANSMGLDANGNIIDFHGGQKDIENKVIRAVGDAVRRFDEDMLRPLRAIRFASRMGFTIDPATFKAISAVAHNITKISQERVTSEILKMADQPGAAFANAIMLMDKTGLLKYVMPEILGLKGHEQDPKHHPEGDVYEHTLAALRVNTDPNAKVNMSILFHDIGKPETKSNKDGKAYPVYYSHDHFGAILMDKIAKRMKLDNDMAETIRFCILNHMRMHLFIEMSTKKVVDLMNDKNFPILRLVSYCDDKSRGSAYKDDVWAKIDAKIEEVKKRYVSPEQSSKIKSSINGARVMRLRGIQGGPDVGKILSKTLSWVMDNNIPLDDDEKIDAFIREVQP